MRSTGTDLQRGVLLQGVLASGLISVGFAGGFLTNQLLLPSERSETSFALVSEANALMDQYFLYAPPDETTRVHGAVRGLVASFDDQYTFFVEPQRAEIDTGNLAGRFGGIGAELTQDEQGRFLIVNVYRDNPAYQAGLQAGDQIVAVDGQRIDDGTYDLDAVLALIRGEIGEELTLTIIRNGQTRDYRMVRAEVLIPSTFWRMLEEDSRIGYIQIARFTDRAAEEVRQALGELAGQGAEAIVLDLRDNGGGLVDSAVDVAGEFLDGGVILYEQRKGQAEQVYNASRGGSSLNLPLVVLVNQNSASASEIVAGALRDRGRAVLIGQRTFGKGSVQLILPLRDGSSIHVTNAQWFTPNHQRIEGEGLIPDVVTEPIEGGDAELLAAVEVLAGQLAAAADN